VINVEQFKRNPKTPKPEETYKQAMITLKKEKKG
jgi:hypothetical protein